MSNTDFERVKEKKGTKPFYGKTCGSHRHGELCHRSVHAFVRFVNLLLVCQAFGHELYIFVDESWNGKDMMTKITVLCP